MKTEVSEKFMTKSFSVTGLKVISINYVYSMIIPEFTMHGIFFRITETKKKMSEL